MRIATPSAACLGIIAVLVSAGSVVISNAVPAAAADLYGRTYSDASPYDDPRYAEIYGDERRRRYADDDNDDTAYEAERERYAGRSYRGDDYDRNDRHVGVGPDDRRLRYRYLDHGRDDELRGHGAPLDDRWRAANGCVPRRAIRDRLLSGGWHDFNQVEFEGRFVRFNATDIDGERFALVLNRCSGRIVARDSLEPPRGRFARGERRWRTYRY